MAEKSIAQYATSLIENNPEPDNVRTIISQPLIKNTFLLVGFGLEKDGSNINNDPSWNPGPTWDHVFVLGIKTPKMPVSW